MKFSAAIFTALLAVVSAAPSKEATEHKKSGNPPPPPPPNGGPWGSQTFSLYVVPVDAGRRSGWHGQYPYLQVSPDFNAGVSMLRLNTDQYPDSFSLEYSSNSQRGSGFLQYGNQYGGFQIVPTQDSGRVGAVPFVVGYTDGFSRMAFSGDLSFDQSGRLSKGWNSNQFYICPTYSQNRSQQNLALNWAQNGVWDNGRSGCYNVWVYRTFNGAQTASRK